MITIQDRYIGITTIEHELSYVNDDKRTHVCAADIAQYFDEYYPEMFENIASDEKAYVLFNHLIDSMRYYSFAEIAIDYLVDNNCNPDGYSFADTLARNYGYEYLDEMERDYMVFIDSALEGAIVFE